MIKKMDRREIRRAKRKSVRKRISGTAQRPRLSVFRSLNHIYAQIIDDEAGKTLAAASSLDQEFRQVKSSDISGGNTEGAKKVGALIAQNALNNGIKSVVFDRGGNIYHGRIAALAQAAREGGLDF